MEDGPRTGLQASRRASGLGFGWCPREDQGQNEGQVPGKKEEAMPSGLTHVCCISNPSTQERNICTFLLILPYRCVSASFSAYFLTDFASYQKRKAHYLRREYIHGNPNHNLPCRRTLSGSFLLTFVILASVSVLSQCHTVAYL